MRVNRPFALPVSVLLAASAAAAAMPETNWDLAGAARERTATRERICLNGWWQFHLGDKPIAPAADAPAGKALLVLDDFEAGVGSFDPRASEGQKRPAVEAVKDARLGRGAMRVRVAPQTGGWRTLTRLVKKLPTDDVLVSVWVKGVRGKVRFRLRLLERRKDGFEIHCTEPIVLTPGDWGKITVGLIQMPYYWGSGATNDKTLQPGSVNEIDFLFELDADGEMLIDQLQLEAPAGRPSPAIPDARWGAAKVPGRIYPKEFQVHLPDGKLLDMPEPKLPTTGWYRRRLTVPAAWRGRRVLLDVGHVNRRGLVFLDGRPIGAAGRLLDVTPRVRFGQAQTLDVYARSTRTGSQWWQQMNWTGGVYGDVWLEARPAGVNVRDVRIITSTANRSLAADVTVENLTDRAASVSVGAAAIEWRPAGPAGEPAFRTPDAPLAVPARGSATVRLAGRWNDARWWSPDTPNLYALRVRVSAKAGGPPLDERVDRFGFREFTVAGGHFRLNGKPFAFRSETSGLGGGLYTSGNCEFLRRYLRFLRGMGFNGSGFGLGEGLSPDKFAQACDEVGIAWLPGWDSWSPRNYERLKNHPSLVGWSTSTWDTLQKWDNQPKAMGRDYFPKWLEGKRKQMLAREADIRRIDPTRVVLHYGCGNVGGIWCNLPYMGLGVPLQSREEVPRDWSARKLKALYAAEFDFPFMYNWRDIDSYERKQAMWTRDRYKAGLHHEHAARYFGEAAYGMSRRLHVNWSDGRDEGGDVAEMVRRVNALFIRRTVRSWRAYEVSGLGLFGLTTGGYAHVVTDFSKRIQPKADWRSLKTPDPKPYRLNVSVPMGELNEVGRAVREALSPILAFLGGRPDFVTKDHAYFADEPIRKQIVLVNGSSSDADVAVRWRLADAAGKVLRRERSTVKCPAGGVRLVGIEVGPLAVSRRASFTLAVRAEGRIDWMNVSGDAPRRIAPRTVTSTDEMAIQVFPRAKAALPGGDGIALFDPVGKTAAALDRLGLRPARLKDLRDLGRAKLLIIGREALDAGTDAASLLRAVRAGLNVVCFEQTPAGLLGESLLPVSQRRAFATAGGHPVLAGLEGADLADWRGASDLREPYPEPPPETERTYPEAYWHWSNHGTVCTYALRKPALGRARAIASCWFDLAAAPLLECVEGRGRVLFCQLDVTGRCGKDPAATRLVANLIRYAAAARPAPQRPLHARKTDRLARLAGWLGRKVAWTPAGGGTAKAPPGSVLLADAATLTARDAPALTAFARAGGRVLVLAPPSAKAVKDWTGKYAAVTGEDRTLRSPTRPDWLGENVPLTGGDARVGRTLLEARPALLAGLADSDFFWRQTYPVRRFAAAPAEGAAGAGGAELLADGLIARLPVGAGEIVLAGIDPTVFHETWAAETTAQTLAFPKALRIVNTLLANLGAAGGEPLSLRPLKREARWRLVFSDDFPGEASAANWRKAGREFAIADGWMHIKAGNGGRNFVLLKRPLADFRLEATLRIGPPGKPLHVIAAFDYQNAGEYYLLSVTSKGFLFNNMTGGGWGKTYVGPEDPIAKITDTRPHRFELQCLGGRVTVTWDGAVAAKTDGIVRKERVENAVAQQNGYVGFGSYYNPVYVSKVRVYEPAAGVAAVARGKHTPVNLRKACTVGFADETADDGRGGWFDSGEADLRMLPPGRQVLGGVTFDVIDPASNGGRSCVIVRSQRRSKLPERAEIPLGDRRARCVYFLHAGGWGGGHLATYTVVYADGSKADVPIRMDKEVGDWYAPFGTVHGGGGSAKRLDANTCCVAWEGPTVKFPSAGLYALAWPNPHPDKPIRKLVVASVGAKGLVGLLAVTLSDAGADLHPVQPATRRRDRPKSEFVPTSLYRAVADRWGYNPDRYRQW